MNETNITSINGKTFLGLGILILLIGGHLLPYTTGYRVPTWDLYKVMHVINYLQYPGLFGGSRVSRLLADIHTSTAPLYYYGIAHPLSYLLPGKWVTLTIGFAITLSCGLFAGRTWKKPWDIARAGLVVFVLIHLFLSPLEGLQRSFTPFFLLGVLWTESSPGYLKRLFLVALAAGIYPPAALLCLTYYGLNEVTRWYQGTTSLFGGGLKLAGFTSVFLLVLTPFWTDLLLEGPDSGVTDFVYPLEYNLSSLRSLLETFLVGGREALFRDSIHFDMFLALSLLLGLQALILGKRSIFRRRHGLLMVASLILWVTAHLAHPLIYQPFKYTRMGLLLGLLLPVVDNLPRATDRLVKKFSSSSIVRWLGHTSAFGCLGVWMAFVSSPRAFKVLTDLPVVGPTFWKFLLTVPVLFSLSVSWPQRLSNSYRSLLTGLVLFLLILLPHSPEDDLNRLSGLFQVLEKSKPASVVAGPPGKPLNKILDTIPAFARRPVYLSHSLGDMPIACERAERMLGVYYETSSEPVLEFLRDTGIDYLLIDRNLFRMAAFTGPPAECFRTAQPTRRAFLNQHFPNAVWSYRRRLYLLTPETLESHS